MHVMAGTDGSASQLYHTSLLPPHAPIVLPSFIGQSMSGTEIMIEQHRQRERERTAIGTQNKRAATLGHSLTLAPQCSGSECVGVVFLLVTLVLM